MSKTFHLTVARVGENLFEGEAISVSLPGTEGVFTVLAGHEAVVSPLSPGNIEIKDAEGTLQTLVIETTGIAEVSNNQATVLL